MQASIGSNNSPSPSQAAHSSKSINYKNNKTLRFLRMLDHSAIKIIEDYISQYEPTRHDKTKKPEKIKLVHDLKMIVAYKNNQSSLHVKGKIDEICMRLQAQLQLSQNTIKERVSKKLSGLRSQDIIKHINLNKNITFDHHRNLSSLQKQDNMNKQQYQQDRQKEIKLLSNSTCQEDLVSIIKISDYANANKSEALKTKQKETPIFFEQTFNFQNKNNHAKLQHQKQLAIYGSGHLQMPASENPIKHFSANDLSMTPLKSDNKYIKNTMKKYNQQINIAHDNDFLNLSSDQDNQHLYLNFKGEQNRAVRYTKEQTLQNKSIAKSHESTHKWQVFITNEQIQKMQQDMQARMELAFKKLQESRRTSVEEQKQGNELLKKTRKRGENYNNRMKKTVTRTLEHYFAKDGKHTCDTQQNQHSKSQVYPSTNKTSIIPSAQPDLQPPLVPQKEGEIAQLITKLNEIRQQIDKNAKQQKQTSQNPNKDSKNDPISRQGNLPKLSQANNCILQWNQQEDDFLINAFQNSGTCQKLQVIKKFKTVESITRRCQQLGIKMSEKTVKFLHWQADNIQGQKL